MNAHSKQPKDVFRLQFDVRQAQLNIIDGLVRTCGLSSKKELFSNAMSLMKWAVKETQKGRRIASYDEKRDEIEVVALPALSFIEQPNKVSNDRTDENSSETTKVSKGQTVSKPKLGVV